MMVALHPKNALRDSAGNVAFYALVILPIVVALTGAVIDISAWHDLRDESQHFADNLALQAAAFLPDERRAVEYIVNAPLPSSLVAAQAEPYFPEGTSLSIGVTVRTRYSGTITRSFPGIDQEHFAIKRQAVAQVVPGDYVLIMADGSTLRPALQTAANASSPFAAAWGNANDWPASGYFHCASAPQMTSTQGTLPWWQYWNDENFQRWATQSCFNPVLSPLKLGVIGVIDELAAAPENRVGMLVTPGDGTTNQYSVLQRLRREATQAGTAPVSPVIWSAYVEGDRFLGDEVCMLFANPEWSFSGRFTLPLPRLDSGSSVDAGGNCPDALDLPACGAAHTPTGHLSSCFIRESLTLRDAVYWHAARFSSTDGPTTPDIQDSIQEAIRQLRDNDLGADTTQLESSRGKLAYKSLRRIIVVSDYLSGLEASGDLSSTLTALAQSHIELWLVGFEHQGLSSAQRSELESSAKQLATLDSGNRTLRTFLASSPEDLQSNVLSQILRVDRQVVLRN